MRVTSRLKAALAVALIAATVVPVARAQAPFEDTPIAPAPLLGQHTREILTDLLGYEPARIEVLVREGAIGVDKRMGETT